MPAYFNSTPHINLPSFEAETESNRAYWFPLDAATLILNDHYNRVSANMDNPSRTKFNQFGEHIASLMHNFIFLPCPMADESGFCGCEGPACAGFTGSDQTPEACNHIDGCGHWRDYPNGFLVNWGITQLSHIIFETFEEVQKLQSNEDGE